MALRKTLTLFNLLFLSVFAQLQYNDPPPVPDPQACKYIIDEHLNSSAVWFDASDFIDCLITVPFDPAVGTRFVKYYTQTLQFQSTSAFLKNPPVGYQQPAFDIFASLQTVQHRIDTGYYRNQYAFEYELQQISHHIHDAHAIISGDELPWHSLSILVFNDTKAALADVTDLDRPYNLVAASEDGKALPKVYKYVDNAINGSAIQTIDAKPTVQWLSEYAANQSFGMLEPHADWNQIMVSPAQLITGATNPLSGGGMFYPGDPLSITYEDGTTDIWQWLAYYYSPGWTGPLETGGDFYNFFVLGNPPDNFEQTYKDWQALQSSPDEPNPYGNSSETLDLTVSDNSECPSSSSWNSLNPAYPENTIMHEACLSLYSTGTISGYLYEGIETAVLSIPTFNTYVYNNSQQAIIDFKGNVTTAKKVIIDLQSCTGGEVGFAFYVFNQFFPNNSPYGGSRRRDHPLADQFGSNLTARFASNEPSLSGNEWVVTNRINAQTGQNFTSWQDFSGPFAQFGDSFSKVEQYDLNNPDFGLNFIYPECHHSGTCSQQWHAEDIIILTDGVCSSTCALFVEMMTEAGVRTVVVGGIPQDGPMQAASGSRGAVSYTSYGLDSDADTSKAVGYTIDRGMSTNYIGITLRHQVRKQGDVPTQFLYQPANCRIYWTFSSVTDYTHLWHDAYNAIWNDTSICVTGSVETQPPDNNSQSPTFKVHLGGFVRQAITSATEYTPVDGDGLSHFRYCDNPVPNTNQFTQDPSKCNGRGQCLETTFPCDHPSATRFVCINECTQESGMLDTCPGNCHLNEGLSGGSNGHKAAQNVKTTVQVKNAKGYCKPSISNTEKLCNVYRKGDEVPLD